jgi:hypothetical protein
MRPAIAVSACALSILLNSCATHSMSRAEKRADETEARAAALHWLQLLDAGDYEEGFEFEVQARRAPFGNALSRKFIGAVHLEKFVGAPEGNYQSVLFKTAFERKNPTAERVILIKQPIGWRVIDYRIY